MEKLRKTRNLISELINYNCKSAGHGRDRIKRRSRPGCLILGNFVQRCDLRISQKEKRKKNRKIKKEYLKMEKKIVISFFF